MIRENMLLSLKKLFWKLYQPLFPTTRDLWVWFGLIKPVERQAYPIGWLRPGITPWALRQALLAAGFEDDYVAWVDLGEVLNLRKVVDEIYQYHIRVFDDGEVRGHYEFTGESHPFQHLREIGMREGFDYLKPLLAAHLK